MASGKSLKIHVLFLMSNMVSSRENFDLAAIATRPDSALDENARNIVLALLEDRSFSQSTIESQTQIITDPPNKRPRKLRTIKYSHHQNSYIELWTLRSSSKKLPKRCSKPIAMYRL